MDMISFGPTLFGVHSPDEKMEIESIPKFWDLLTNILKNVPQK
jgi:dipeptidase D